MFIDDLYGLSTGSTRAHVVNQLTAAAVELSSMIQYGLSCLVAQRKSVILSSCPRLTDMLKTSFGKYTGNALPSAPNLGIVCGVRRAEKGKSFVRFSKLQKRGSRLRALKKTAPPEQTVCIGAPGFGL